MIRDDGTTARTNGRPFARATGAVVLAISALCSPDGSGPAVRVSAGPGQAVVVRTPSPVAVEIQARLSTTGQPGGAPLAPGEAGALAALYAPGGSEPVWFEASGRASRDAREAAALLAAAPVDGLDPADYGVATLTAWLAATDQGWRPTPGEVADADLMLSAAILRYFRHLHLGRVDPATIGVRLVVEPERHDFVALLHAAVTTHSLASTAAGLAPPLPQYAALRRQLARYRAIGDEGSQPLPAAATPLRPGDRYGGAERLHRRLQAFGDLPPDAPTPVDAAVYDRDLADAVRRFQERHGLKPHGVLDAATRAALDVPAERRARQIELALERLRWLPDLGDERVIALNIPMFRLWTSGGIGANQPGPAMRAIVGRALRTETPVFVAALETVVFRPYWNVPRSILLKEMLPAFERDSSLAGQGGFEVVRGWTEPADVVPIGPDTVEGLRRGTLRLRQRPGPGNALGLVKFVFPNDADVYLHGTPATELFGRARRDLSHGCIRVEDPVALAEWVLAEEPGWDRPRIEGAMAASSSSIVTLSTAIRVVLFYTTAAVMPEDGSLHFADDIYGHDATLAAALAPVPTRP